MEENKNVEVDLSINEEQLKTLQEKKEKASHKPSKEELELVRQRLPSRRVMRKIMKNYGHSFTDRLNEKFRKKRLNESTR